MRTMTEIENPRYSRPIDVHRWSDHSEVKTLVEHIWGVWLPEEITGKPGVKKAGRGTLTLTAQSRHWCRLQLFGRNQLKLTIINAYPARRNGA